MCYICEARGTVGANYKAAQKAINAALTTWRRSGGAPTLRRDLTNAPSIGKRLWSNKDLKEYGKAWRQEHGLI